MSTWIDMRLDVLASPDSLVAGGQKRKTDEPGQKPNGNR